MQGGLDACRVRRGNPEDAMDLVESVVGERKPSERINLLRPDVRQATLLIDREVTQGKDEALGDPAGYELESGRGSSELRACRTNGGEHATEYETEP